MTTISAALDAEALLAPHFRGESWSLWRAILRAAEGLPLSAEQEADFREVAERDPPQRRVRELWVIAGRRSGKDSIASGIATVVALGDYRARLRPGEPAVVMCLAVDRVQAAICHKYIVAYFKSIPLLQPMVVRETDDGLELTNGVEIVIATNSFRSVRGRTIVCCIFDEVAFWRSEDSATPDFEVYTAIEPAMATLPDALLIGISSPYRRGGLLYRKFTEAYGKPDPDVLVVRGPSRRFNPLLPQRVVDAALERDPEGAQAEWLAQWRDDLSDYIDRAIVESCVMPGVAEIAPSPSGVYYGFFDPAAGSGGDSAALAVGHGQDGDIVIDAIREWRPPFLPTTVVAEAAPFLHSYGISRIVGDRFAGLWSVEPFAERGIVYEQSAAPKSDQYRDCLPILNSRRMRLPDNRRLVTQFCSLERQVTRSGKDAIAEPRGAHDDLCNAVAGVAGLISAGTAPALWKVADLRTAQGNPVFWPLRCLSITAVAAADQRGVFVTYWALHADRYPLALRGQFGPRTLLIDFTQAPLSPGLFPSVVARLDELTAATLTCPITHRTVPATSTPPFVFVTRELLPHAAAAGLDARGDATLLLEASRPALLLAAAAAIGAGDVKVSNLAEETARCLPLPLAAIRPDGAEPTAAADCCLIGIGVSLPWENQPREWRGLALM